MERALVGATGKALAMIAALLHRGGIATPAQFSDLLSALAGAVATTERAKQNILKSWSMTIGGADTLERGVLLADGEAMAALGSFLDRGGIAPLREFAALLGLYACTVAETLPEEGDILAYWAAIVKDSARPVSK